MKAEELTMVVFYTFFVSYMQKCHKGLQRGCIELLKVILKCDVKDGIVLSGILNAFITKKYLNRSSYLTS